MSDQELDDLFKEASAKYEAPFDEKEWEKMAAMLDATSSPKPGFWNWKIISGLALLLLMSGTVVVIQWDKISGKEGRNNQREVGLPTADSVSPMKETNRVIGEENLIAKDKNKTNEEDNQGKVQMQSQIQSQSSLAELKDPSQNTLQPSVLNKNADKDNSRNQLNEKPVASKKKKKVVVVTEKRLVANKSDNTNKWLTNRNKEESQNDDSINKTKIGKEMDKESVSLADQQLSSNGNKTAITTSKNVVTGNVNRKSPSAISNSEKEEGDNHAEQDNNALANTTNKSVAPVVGNNPIALTREGAEKEKSGEVIANDNLSDKQNDNSNTLLANSVVKKEKDEVSPDSAKVIFPQDKKDSVIDKEVKKEEKNKLDSSSRLHRFSVKLALSPDFSSVGYFKPGKTGFNYGLLAEYNITPHWSLTLGGIWSRKIYADTRTESSGYGTVNTTQIKGSCRVLDLPLNINYYITPQNAFSLYVSAGLSSYFMFDEDYTYDYVYGTKQYSYTKKIDRGNTEWFRMMNLSVGIQQQLSPHVRLQLEPFIKAPLSGIGGGDLKLVSSGVFLNLKYTFK